MDYYYRYKGILIGKEYAKQYVQWLESEFWYQTHLVALQAAIDAIQNFDNWDASKQRKDAVLKHALRHYWGKTPTLIDGKIVYK